MRVTKSIQPDSRLTRLPRRFALVVAMLLLLATGLSLHRAEALVHPVTITINGDFTDWTTVLAGPENTRNDTVGTADPDPQHTQADISRVAATFDATHLSGYVQLDSTSLNQPRNIRAHIDLDGDGRMQATDPVAIITFRGNRGQHRVLRAPYIPQDPAGDLLLGDGNRPPGTIGTPVRVEDASFASSDIVSSQIEFRITWTRLGVPAGSPVNIQLAALPSATNDFDLRITDVDNAPVISLRHFGVTVAPNNTGAVAAGDTVSYTHTVTNTGNGTERFNLTATSSLGWGLQIRDTASGVATSAVFLARGASRSITVLVSSPATAAIGSSDVTTFRARHSTRTTITATATNTTRVIHLGTYRDAGHTVSANLFNRGDTVFTRATGLLPGSQVRLRWLDPAGTQVAQSATITVSADGRASASHVITSTAPSGRWAVALINVVTGVEIERLEFDVDPGVMLSLTIPGALVDFGALTPGVPSPTRSVDLVIQASVPYTLTRVVSGQVSEMGLTISGDASRSMPAGNTTITDTLQATAPWTTDPEIPLEVTISYTLVH